MSDEGSVRLERDGEVATITFVRPGARNAMTWPMYEQLQAACRTLRDDKGCRAVVLRGAGGQAFVAGTDIEEFTGFASGEDGVAYEVRMEEVFSDLESLPQPTVAVIDGFATGSGLLMSAICDIRIATPGARFGMPIARTLGNCLSMQNYARLVGALGASRVSALILTASFLTGEEARDAGFVLSVHEPEDLDDAVRSLVSRIVQHAPMTMWATKESLRRLRSAGPADDMDLIRAVFGSADFKEGVDAFLAKRPAQWAWR